MLVSFSFENVSSFKDAQNLSLETSPLKKDQILSVNTMRPSQENELLKSTLIYGANASGKTNLIKAIGWLKEIILSSYSTLDQNQNILRSVIPFLLDMKSIEKPSEFEVIFIEDKIKYRYGISVFNGEIVEEWLYYTNARETLLFIRNRQQIEYNRTSFEEANLFVKTKKDTEGKGLLEKTAPNIPFVSVLAVFQGKHSLNVTKFFSRIHVLSGIEDESLGAYTFNLLKENKGFYNWTLNILKDFNISSLIINEEKIFSQKINFPHPDKIELKRNLSQQLDINRINVQVTKQINESEETIEIPLELESAGTRKIIHLLGPMYDTIQKGNILFIDEFDSKFHTLLSKHIFKIFHRHCKSSQIIANVQDTNLMDTDLFRRDQIWFVHKDPVEQDSQLYSLAEYKNAIKKSYSQDYLQGAFDAIPLFSTVDEIEGLMEG